MGYISKGDRITLAEQDLIDIIGTLGAPLSILRVNAAGTSLEYAAAGAGDVSAAANFDTDNVIIRSDGTSKGVQKTGIVIDDSNNIYPNTSDGSQLGSTTKMFSDLFLASGAVINFNNGNATITHSAGLLTSNVDIVVPAEAYGVGWNGSNEVPTKNDVYDKIETISTSGLATVALDNLAAVAINAALVLATSDAFALGSATKMWSDLFLADGAVINFNNGNVTLTHSAGVLTLGGTSTLALGSNSITMTGSLGTTGARLTKGWFTDLEVTNAITGSITGNAATVTTNANLTGHITSTGNAAVLGSFTKAQLDTAVSDGNVIYSGDALGTPSSGTLTNCTGLPVNGIVDDTTSALGVGTLELGHASDTTLSRSAAGVLAVEGIRVKTTTPLVVSAASYTTDTGTSLNMDNLDMFIVTAQAGALLFNSPSGTLVQGRSLVIRIKDNGTARALTWNAVFRAMGTALPSTTVLGKTLYLGFFYNSTDTKWDLVASAQEA